MNYLSCKRIFFSLCCIAFSAIEASPCTSAIVAADASASGRPLLWKHRDTSNTDNVIDYIPGKDGEHSYVALYNATDTMRDEAWIGMNEVGFAVMNTASYNIKDDKVPQSKMDREGFVMSIALRSCTTVDDFEALLNSLPRPMGVEANFGVIDAYGNGAFFETNNHSYVKYDLSDAPGGVLIRTNYSHSGRKGEGYGYVRKANANHILAPYIGEGGITPELLTENLSRNFYHDVNKTDGLSSSTRWIVDEDYIPRYKSTATVVIEGIQPLDLKDTPLPEFIIPEYIMWTGLGYPPCSEIVPVWCHADGVDDELKAIAAGGTSPKANLARSRRDIVFNYPQGTSKKRSSKYIDTHALSNSEGTGFIQVLTPENLEVYRLIKEKRDRKAIDFKY